jgi:hypothetical protein
VSVFLDVCTAAISESRLWMTSNAAAAALGRQRGANAPKQPIAVPASNRRLVGMARSSLELRFILDQMPRRQEARATLAQP